jgi:hypothetical protein
LHKTRATPKASTTWGGSRLAPQHPLGDITRQQANFQAGVGHVEQSIVALI